jgi:hypothetical protein
MLTFKTPNPARPRTPFVVALVIAAIVAMLYFWSGAERQAEVVVPVVQPVAQAVSQEPAPAPAQEESPAPVASSSAVSVPESAIVEPAPAARYVVREGDVMTARFGKAAAAVCALNKIRNCDVIHPGQELLLPTGVKAGKYVVRAARNPSCITLGVAPWNPEHQLERTLEGINQLTTLTPVQKAVAKQKVMSGEKASKDELTGRTVFREMLYQSRESFAKAKHVYDKPVCTSEEGGKVEVMDTYDLGDGTYLAIPKRCGNPAVYVKPVEPVEPVLPPEPKEVTPPAEPETPKAVVTARYDPDYDLGLYAGADPDVVFAGFEGAFYPWLNHVDAGRHAFGIGAKGDWWDGRTHTGFNYDGYTLAYGPAYKWSDKTRRDLNLKLLFGRVKENGHQGGYESDQAYRAICLASNYTDASREREGKEAVPEWTFWMNYCQLKAKSYGHTWQGQPIADTSALGKSTALISIGTRIYLHRNLETAGVASGDAARKLQPFFELGANQEVPMDPSGHVYLGVRTSDKLWTFGAGAHISHEGTVPGAGITYDAGRKIHMEVKDARWQEMRQAFEAAGISID